MQVNGKPTRTLPVFINPRTDRVRVDGREIDLASSMREKRESRVYIALHKPDNTLSTTTDAEGEAEAADHRGARRTVMDLVKGKGLPRLFPVGRLGFHDTGLVLLTNDGELANRLTHARYGVPRTYRVVVRGRVEKDVLERIGRKVASSLAVRPDAESAPPVRLVPSESGDTALEVTLRESPKLRIDALLFEAGLKVKRLVRLAIGPVSLRGIVSGNWRKLSGHELDDLLAAAGMVAKPEQSDKRLSARPASRGRPGSRNRPGTKPNQRMSGASRPGGKGRIRPGRRADQR